jgi:hypothetical protein
MTNKEIFDNFIKTLHSYSTNSNDISNRSYNINYIDLLQLINIARSIPMEKKEDKTSMELIREAFNPIQNARCSECNELIGTNAAHICQNKFEPKSIFTRRMERNARTYDFVVKHKVLIYQNTRHYGNFTAGKNDCQLQELITLARKEIGYSDKTWSGDIFISLVNLYRKICV